MVIVGKMRHWEHKIKIRHLLAKKEDWKSIQNSMNKIADVLEKDEWFKGCRWIKKFREIPKDNFIDPADYADKLLEKMWDFCDINNIWVKL